MAKRVYIIVVDEPESKDSENCLLEMIEERGSLKKIRISAIANLNKKNGQYNVAVYNKSDASLEEILEEMQTELIFLDEVKKTLNKKFNNDDVITKVEVGGKKIEACQCKGIISYREI